MENTAEKQYIGLDSNSHPFTQNDLDNAVLHTIDGEKVGEATGEPRIGQIGTLGGAVNVLEVKEKEPEAVKDLDLYQPRKVVLTREIKGKGVEFTHQSVALSNKVWLDYNETLNPRNVLNTEGKFEAKNDEEKAVREMYKALVKEIPTGYQQYFKTQLTKENFYELIPISDQRKVLEEIFSYEISESDKDEFFFDETDENLFEIDLKINGEIETILVALSAKTKKTEESYKEAIKPKRPLLRRFRDTEISTMADLTKLQQIFDKLTNNQNLPAWIKVGIIRFYFDDFGQSEVKK